MKNQNLKHMKYLIVKVSKRVIPHRWRMKLIGQYQGLLHWWRYDDPYFPHTICLEVSAFCNRTCHYCPNSLHKTPLAFMPEDLFLLCLKRLEEMKWAGPVDYNFYNEPTLDKRLPRLVSLTRKHVPRAMPRIMSNGDVLTEAYTQELITAGVINFSVTRHPPFKAEWDERMERLKRRYPAYITVNEIWKRENNSNRGGAVAIENYQPLTSCLAPSASLNILRNGDVVLCCSDYHRENRFGNIREKTILEIWNNPAFRQVREEVRKGQPRLAICKQCFGVSEGKAAASSGVQAERSGNRHGHEMEVAVASASA